MLRTIIAIPAFVALSLATPAYAQSPVAAHQQQKTQADTAASAANGVGNHSTPGTLSASDQHFLQESAQGSTYEMALAQLALQKATKPDIRLFAQTIVHDHEQINAGLEHLAQVKNVQLPTTMKHEDQVRLEHFKSLNGSAFDHGFTTEEARINSKDKLEDETEAGSTSDTDLKAFVQQMQIADANHQKLSQHL